jgi:hypothetical protein
MGLGPVFLQCGEAAWSTTIILHCRLDSGIMLLSPGRCLDRMLPTKSGNKIHGNHQQGGAEGNLGNGPNSL